MSARGFPRRVPPASARELSQNERETCSVASPLDLKSLFETHYASMWRLLKRLGVSAERLDDAAQEVFWVAARRLEDIRTGSEHAFLYGVALRVASNERRRQGSELPLADSGELLRLRDAAPSPEEQLTARRTRELLDRALSHLPYELRTVFVLFELEGLEVREIASLEGIPVGTASSRLRRARAEFSLIAKRLRAGWLDSEGTR